jgi:hypothetical protein
MRRVFSYVLFLFGLFCMMLGVLSIFQFITTAVDSWLAVTVMAFGLIICLVAVFILAPGGGVDPDQLV